MLRIIPTPLRSCVGFARTLRALLLLALALCVPGRAFIAPSAAQQLTGGNLYSGTWTPVIRGASTTGTPTYSVQSGSYQVAGRLVEAQATIVLSNLGEMAGSLNIIGMPVPSASVANDNGNCIISNFNGWTGAAGYTYITAYVIPSTSQFTLIANGSGKASVGSDASEWANNLTLVMTCMYHT